MPHPVLDTTDYRTALQVALAHRGALQRDLARAVGRSEGWLSNILSGKRKLDPAQVPALSAALGLDDEVGAYLSALVDLESSSERVRASGWATVQASQRQRAAGHLSEDVAQAFGQWHVGAIAELARCEGFRAEPAWIAATLDPPISVAEAEAALTLLVRLELLVPDGAGGLRGGAPTWSPSDLPPGPISEAAATLHRDALQLAAGALRGSRHNERHHSTTTLAVPEARLAAFLSRLRELERELLAAEGPASGEVPNRVYLLGIQLFPVSRYTDADPLG
jgi:uncharacterized protein (TIGR02147 family)